VSEVGLSSFQFASKQWSVTKERVKGNEYLLLVTETYTRGVQLFSEHVTTLKASVDSRMEVISRIRKSLLAELSKACESGSVAHLGVLPYTTFTEATASVLEVKQTLNC